MKTRSFVYGMMMFLLAGCSSNDDLLVERPIVSDMDEENVTRDDLMGDVPIEFASIGGSATVEMTRGSSNVNGAFQSGTMGIYCIGAKKINEVDAQEPKMGGYNTALWQILNLWLENVSAHVESLNNGNNEGYIAWDNPEERHYYPKKDWYAYKFAAYHPRTDYIVRSESAVMAFIPIDGNDDVFTAIADDPHASIDPETDAKAYSQQYFEAVGAEITPDHKPYYNFKHLTSRLKFKVKLKEDCEREMHVDSISFTDFPNIMKVSLAKFDNGELINNWNNYNFVLNMDDYMPQKLKNDLPTKTVTVNGQPEEKVVVNGHFWLRDVDDSSIGEKVNGNYKYVLNTNDYIDVGDCIMIPPVYKSHSKSTIKLQVFLRDNYGNLYTTLQPIEVAAPEADPADPEDKGGWKSGKSYTVRVSVGGNIFFMDQTRGQMTAQLDDYEEEDTIDVTD